MGLLQALTGVLLAALLAGSARLAADTSIPQLEKLARQALAAKDANGALAAYRKLAQIVPGSAAYQDEIGFLLAATNRNAEAIPYFENATRLDSKMAVAWYHLGVASWLAQHPETAIKALRNAVTLAPGNGDFHFRLGSAYSNLFEDAKAIPELTLAAKLLPQKAEVWGELGHVYQRQKRYVEARDAYRHALSFDANNNAIRNSYATVLVNAGNPAAGLAEFHKILANDPGNYHVLVNLGYAYIGAGNYKEAIKQLSEVIQTHPEAADAHYDLAVAYKQTDDLAHARTELEQAVKLDPSLAEAHYVLGLVYVDASELEKAVEQFRLAVQQKAGYVDAWFQLGMILKQQGDVTGAIDALRHSVALDPRDAGAYNTLGLLLRREGDAQGAKEAFDQAAAIRASEEEAKEKSLRQGTARLTH